MGGVQEPDTASKSRWGHTDGVSVNALDGSGGGRLGPFRDGLCLWRRMGESSISVRSSDTVAGRVASEARVGGSCAWPEPRSGGSLWVTWKFGSGSLTR